MVYSCRELSKGVSDLFRSWRCCTRPWLWPRGVLVDTRLPTTRTVSPILKVWHSISHRKRPKDTFVKTRLWSRLLLTSVRCIIVSTNDDSDCSRPYTRISDSVIAHVKEDLGTIYQSKRLRSGSPRHLFREPLLQQRPEHRPSSKSSSRCVQGHVWEFFGRFQNPRWSQNVRGCT